MTSDSLKHYADWEMFALGVLDDQEQRDMAAHLDSGCGVCAECYLAARTVVAGLAALSPDASLPLGAEMRLKERLEREGAPFLARSQPVSFATRWKVPKVVPWVLAAACLIAAVALEVSRRNLSHALQEQQRLRTR